MRDLRGSHQLKEFSSQMRRRAVARRGIEQATTLTTRQRNQLAHIACRQRRMHDQQTGAGHQHRHWREIAHTVER